MTHTTLNQLIGAVALASLSACASFQDTPPKAQPVTAASMGLQDPQTAPSPAVAVDAVAPDWWHAFGDAQLNALMDQALASSPSLGLAQARLARAQAGFDMLQGNDLPQVSAQADLTHQRFSNNFIYPPPLGGAVMDSGTVQADVSWELDFFGKNRRALDAAVGRARAAQADAQAARVLLTSAVARSYFQWVKLDADLAVARRTLAQREHVRELVQERLRAGLDTQLELQQSEGAIPDAQLQIEQLREQQDLARNALTALTAQRHMALAPVAPDRLQELAAVAPLASALPLDLLGRRADIEAARWRVEAAAQDVDHAKTQFYPNINLVAFAGFQSIGFDRLFNSASEQWGVGPAIRLPLFDAGHLRANLRGKSADLDAAVESYNAQVRDAVREVSDHITSSRSVAQQLSQQARAQAAAQNAYAIASQRYQAGLGTYLHVLSAESAVLAQQRLGLDLAARAVDTRIQLIHALGGGFAANTAL